ncbi:hypothetical protein Tco_1007958 [Tanacetum coccineum]
MPSFPPPEPTVSCFDDLDFFKDFENEFPAIVYNNAQTSKSDLLTEPILNPQHINEFNLKDETSLSEYKDNDYDKVDIEHSSGDLSVKPLPDVINTDVGAYAHGVLYKVEDIATYLVEYVKFWDDWEVDRYGNANLVPPKEKDPGGFIISYIMGQSGIMKALADLGASISLMPYSMFLQLNLEILPPNHANSIEPILDHLSTIHEDCKNPALFAANSNDEEKPTPKLKELPLST